MYFTPPLPLSQQQIEKKSTKTEGGGKRDLIYVNRKPFSHKAMYKSLSADFWPLNKQSYQCQVKIHTVLNVRAIHIDI